MKDPHDSKTIDALEPPKRGRGRPATGKAKSQAQRAKEYRERRKESDRDRAISAYLSANDSLVNALDFAQKEYGWDWVRHVNDVMTGMELHDAGQIPDELFPDDPHAV